MEKMHKSFVSVAYNCWEPYYSGALEIVQELCQSLKMLDIYGLIIILECWETSFVFSYGLFELE